MKILGLDVGSTIVKCALVDTESNNLFLHSSSICGEPIEKIDNIFKEIPLLRSYDALAITGSSRNLIGEKYNADYIKPEILAHVHGVKDLLSKNSMIIEIGGQDSKLIILHNKVMKTFKMNSNCAAGTGAFIEAQARRYGLSISEFDRLSNNETEIININTKCATFLESSLINLQRQGIKKSVLARTVFFSLANNYLNSLCQNIDFNDFDNIFFLGGVSKLETMRSAFSTLINHKIIVPPNSDYTGAIGIAKMFLQRSNIDIPIDNASNSYFKQCTDCINKCMITCTKSNESLIYSGGLCGKYNF